MEVALTIAHKYNVSFAEFGVTQYADGSTVIETWNLSEPKPSLEELEMYWNEHKDEILEANKPQPSETETLKEQQELMQQAIDDLILGGML